MTPDPDHVRKLAAHIRASLGDGPLTAPGGWTHMGAVICDASFQARRKYETTIRPRILALQTAWPDAATVKGFQARLATEDLATAMNFHDPLRVAIAHRITDLLAANDVDTRDDLHTWLGDAANHTILRTVHGVGPKTLSDSVGNLEGRGHLPCRHHRGRGRPCVSRYCWNAVGERGR